MGIVMSMKSKSSGDMLFHEVQRVRSRWWTVPVYPGALFLIGYFGAALYRQLGRGLPLGREPMPDTVLWALGPCMILVGVFLVFLCMTMRLVTTVRRDGLHIRYVPFLKRQLEIRSIERCEACRYRPVRDYGGWGIRGSRRHRAYNVWGRGGVLLSFRNGSTLMIGSQRADELAREIGTLMGG
jgi:hypothetical protein